MTRGVHIAATNAQLRPHRPRANFSARATSFHAPGTHTQTVLKLGRASSAHACAPARTQPLVRFCRVLCCVGLAVKIGSQVRTTGVLCRCESPHFSWCTGRGTCTAMWACKQLAIE